MNSFEKIEHWQISASEILKKTKDHEAACEYFINYADQDTDTIIDKSTAMHAGMVLGYAMALGDLMSGDVNITEMKEIER